MISSPNSQEVHPKGKGGNNSEETASWNQAISHVDYILQLRPVYVELPGHSQTKTCHHNSPQEKTKSGGGAWRDQGGNPRSPGCLTPAKQRDRPLRSRCSMATAL